jgi:hypothetical protein
MKNAMRACLLVVLCIVAISAPLFAHHGNASYENKTVTLKGTVTAWLWTNPHSFLKIDVTDDSGKVQHWICENQAPSTLVNFGYTAKTFKPGDQVTVVMAAVARNGAPVGRINKVILANGFVMDSEVR